jgi:hypothetical protein
MQTDSPRMDELSLRGKVGGIVGAAVLIQAKLY